MTDPQLVLGTAGHIDHGKSSLVKALTGVDPDRLAEEKKRGITIELGFARLDLPSGRSLGVIDVPGHEKFVRQMVAGAAGIDIVMLVVAADDGVMPQTREHLAIVDLLGIDRGVVALTKADLADPDWIALVTEDIKQLLVGTGIEGAAIVPVSSKTGSGLDDIRAALDDLAAEGPSKQLDRPMRLPVDRVFTIAGAGTVVTGTMWTGRAKRDDQVEIMPGGQTARVRSVQVHSETVDEAHAGQRVAMNLVGVEKDEISRGDVVCAPGSLTLTDRFDARFIYLGWEGRPIESGTRVHVHHGTREVLGRVLLMDSDRLVAGESGLAQLRLEEPLVPRYGDRFIVRSYSPVFTVGGGEILDVLPPRRTQLKDHERELLDALIAHDAHTAAIGLVASRGIPMTSAEVASALGVPRADVADALNRSDLGRLKVGGDTYFVAQEAIDATIVAVESALLRFHEERPKETGIAVPALRDQVDRRLSAKLFDEILAVAVERGVAEVGAGMVRHAKAGAGAVMEESEAMEALATLLAKQALEPGTVAQLSEEAGLDVGVARKALAKLASSGRVIRLSSDMHFDAAAMEAARGRIVAFLKDHGEMAPKDARDVLGSSRKYVVPILEYLDATGVTKRSGDVRVLRG